jgi:hypothetical protein
MLRLIAFYCKERTQVRRLHAPRGNQHINAAHGSPSARPFADEEKESL